MKLSTALFTACLLLSQQLTVVWAEYKPCEEGNDLTLEQITIFRSNIQAAKEAGCEDADNWLKETQSEYDRFEAAAQAAGEDTGSDLTIGDVNNGGDPVTLPEDPESDFSDYTTPGNSGNTPADDNSNRGENNGGGNDPDGDEEEVVVVPVPCTSTACLKGNSGGGRANGKRRLHHRLLSATEGEEGHCSLDNNMVASLSCPKNDGGSGGDPHFKNWKGEFFDFHGQCDLVLLQNPTFRDHLGMEIHIRTTVRFDYSFIEAAAIMIGNDILEVGGHGNYMINGVLGTNDDEMPFEFAGFPLVLHASNKNKHVYDIHVGPNGQIVQIKTFKDWLSIAIDNATAEYYQNSKGLMGQFETGKPIARDGTILGEIDDEDTAELFGNEWQVRDTDVSLFDTMEREPQFPQRCIMPATKYGATAASLTRRLAASDLSEEQVEQACAHITNEKARMNCKYDVVASGDLSMAEAGVF